MGASKQLRRDRRRARPRGRGAVVIQNPHFMPRFSADADKAIVMVWRLCDIGAISWDEAARRDEQLRFQRRHLREARK
jgi:hypothetical protein